VVVAAEARGLAPGSDVWVAGSPAGRVTAVSFGDPHGPEDRRVVIQATIHHAAVPYLGRDTRATISPGALLEPVVLKLDPQHPAGGPFDPSDTLFVPADRTVERFLALAADSRSILDSLHAVSTSLRKRLRDGPSTLASLQADTSLQLRMVTLAHSARRLSDAFTPESELARFLADDSTAAALQRVTAGLGSLSRRGREEGVADSALAVAAALESIAARLASLDADLRAGRGTAGRALYDDEIERQEAQLRARLDSLRSDIRERPWRWLRLHLF